MVPKLLGNSAMPQYIKILAAGILSVTYLGSLYIYGVDLLNNATPPAVVTLVIGTGLSVALTALGQHSGAQLAESSPTLPTSITLPLPQTQAQIGASSNASPQSS